MDDESVIINYRGYAIIYGNGVGCYIWHGSDYLESVYGPSNPAMVKKAKAIIDEWMEGK